MNFLKKVAISGVIKSWVRCFSFATFFRKNLDLKVATLSHCQPFCTPFVTIKSAFCAPYTTFYADFIVTMTYCPQFYLNKNFT